MLAISRISMILRQNGEKLRSFFRIRRKVEKWYGKKITKVTGSQITILYVIRIWWQNLQTNQNQYYEKKSEVWPQKPPFLIWRWQKMKIKNECTHASIKQAQIFRVYKFPREFKKKAKKRVQSLGSGSQAGIFCGI